MAPAREPPFWNLLPMEAGDIVIILRGTLHGVTVCDRLEDRMTLNFHV